MQLYLLKEPSTSRTYAIPPDIPAAKLRPVKPRITTHPPVIYSQPWSPTPCQQTIHIFTIWFIYSLFNNNGTCSEWWSDNHLVKYWTKCRRKRPWASLMYQLWEMEGERGGGINVPDHTMKAYRGSRSMAPHSLNLSSSGGQWSISCWNHFTSRKEPWHPLSKRQGGSHSLSGIFAEQKNLLPLPGYEPWIFQPVTSLYWLSYPGSPFSWGTDEDQKTSVTRDGC